MKEIKDYLNESINVKTRLLNDEITIRKINKAFNLILESLDKGGKIIFAGNGGSAADSQHLAAEFVSRFMFDRPGLPSIALTTDTSVITAIGNDYGYELLFKRQLQALANNNDIFIGISTSGNSKNIINALEFCNEINIKSIGLTGSNKGIMNSLCSLTIEVPSNKTSFIQESHIAVGHILCMLVEEKLYGNLK